VGSGEAADGIAASRCVDGLGDFTGRFVERQEENLKAVALGVAGFLSSFQLFVRARSASAHFPKFVLHRSTHLHELRKVMALLKCSVSKSAFIQILLACENHFTRFSRDLLHHHGIL